MVSAQWLKGRFFHTLLLDTSEGGPNNGNPDNDSREEHLEATPIVRLSEIALLNDHAVRILVDGRVGLALHVFTEALGRAQKFTPVDSHAVKCRGLAFHEVMVTPSSAANTTGTQESIDTHYLVPVLCADEGNVFSKAILLRSSHLPASVGTLQDVLQFHLGLCRHIQACESLSAPRRLALLDIAAKRYKKVQGKGLVRAAAYRNLVSSGGVSFLQSFLDAYHSLEDPEEISEFRNYIIYAAEAA